ncbi:HET-domain-containing protein [Annulohypoxylon maeteangense]|uniref:HET-domain-containing protein n=1 Tax=Annulohypoxylon maeteangense TaxID=1927788 RepID=UPI002008227F|nr:HET-domain-containing protein [Annulohypoxylon maeteangense]KAI0880893.1 HET-domain-containing protein [Annulohypoxylon maeteangense]
MEEGIAIYEDAVLDSPCSYCKLLEFNDLQQGGDARVSKDGTPFVYFGVIQDTMNNILGGGIMHPQSPEHEEKRDFAKTEFQLGYHRSDTLPDLPEMAKTASQGCTFCYMLRKDISCVWDKKIRNSLIYNLPENEKTDRAKLTITDITYKFSGGSRIANGKGGEEFDIRPWLDMLMVYFTVKLEGGKGNDFSFHYNFHTQSSDPSAIWLNLWRRPIPLGGFSAARLERLNELVHRTLIEFPSSTEDTYLPTRLIDVGTKTTEHLKLIITKEYQPLLEVEDHESLRYVALSYCWGSGDSAKEQLKTTKDSLEDHLQGIKPETLPKTIADAVMICREIGVRYIWVDALCIIQGDEEDWTRESFKMSQVYAKSFLTLCVLRGDSCSSGFLGKRVSQATLRISFRSTLDTSISGSLYLSMSQPPTDNLKEHNQLFGRPTAHTDRVAEVEFRDSTWNSRGWTLQEALLSPRKIYFGNLMMYATCGKFCESEDGTRFMNWTQSRAFPLPTEEKSTVLWSSPWYSVLSEYFTRSLSYNQDKLPAISALARTFSHMYPGQRYLAGLWDSDIESGLLWTPNVIEDAHIYLQKRKDEYIAPTWSWASNPKMTRWVWGVGQSDHFFIKEFELRESEIITQEMNPYGRVYGGHLLLHAKTSRVPLGDDDKPNVLRVERGDSSEYTWLGIIFPYGLRSKDGEYIAYLQFDWDMNGYKNTDRYPDGPIDRLSMVLLSSCGLNRVNMNSRKYLKDPEIMLGLLVMEADDGGGFEKVGLFYSENKGLGGRKFWEDIERQEIKLV